MPSIRRRLELDEHDREVVRSPLERQGWSGHDLANLVEGYRHLAVAERWEIYNPKARTANVSDWGWFGERVRIHDAVALPLTHGTAPGSLLLASREGIDIACGDGALRIRVLQREGGKPITAADWVNARRDPVSQ